MSGRGWSPRRRAALPRSCFRRSDPASSCSARFLGIGLVGLIQLSIIGRCGLALTVPTHVLTLPVAAVGAVLAGLMWFVLGFILYALMIAAASSLVSRVEEVQTAVLPVTMLLILSWLLAYVVAIPAISAAQGATVPARA